MFEVVTVHRDEVCSVAVLDWDSDDCEMAEAVFDREEDAWEWADANYPAYFMDPRLSANDWKAWRFIVRPV